MLNDLTEIVAIPSVEAAPSGENAPFGAELRRALDWFIQKADSYGLKTGENNGYCAWADYGDESKPIIGIVAHIDVVPAGSGWTHEPFTLHREGATLFGRGVSDNKGALCMALHCLKKFKEEKRVFKHRIRLIVGCNEETGSRCIQRYAEQEEIPVVSLVPDSDFPVINSEKAILQLNAVFKPDDEFKKAFKKFRWGDRPNIVPEEASFAFEPNNFNGMRFLAFGDDYLDFPTVKKYRTLVNVKKEDVFIDRKNGKVKVTVKGKAAHGSTPEKGDNAAWKAWALITGCMPHCDFAHAMLKLCNDKLSEKLGFYGEDDRSGKLTTNMGITDFDGDKLTVTFDFRLPLCCDKDKIIATINALPYCESTCVASYSPNLFFEPDSPFISTLVKIYNETTGDNAGPVQSGGGTYAKGLPNAVAFGIAFPGSQSHAHGADEQIKISDLEKAGVIYEKTIEALDKLYK